MTDIRNAGTPREILLTTTPSLNASGLVREVLLANATAATMAGLVREVLLVGDPVTARQHAVTVVS